MCSPSVLHSYGVGRTGVYCLLHTMYHQIKRERSVSIYQIARLYNHLRPHCILTKVSMATCYIACAAAWLSYEISSCCKCKMLMLLFYNGQCTWLRQLVFRHVTETRETNNFKWKYSRTCIKRPPFKQPPSIKWPFLKVPNYFSVSKLQYMIPLLSSQFSKSRGWLLNRGPTVTWLKIPTGRRQTSWLFTKRVGFELGATEDKSK